MGDIDLDFDLDGMLDEALDETLEETKVSSNKKNKKKKKKAPLCSEAIAIENCAKEFIPAKNLEQWIATLRKDTVVRSALEEKLKEENKRHGSSYMPCSNSYTSLYRKENEDNEESIMSKTVEAADLVSHEGNIEKVFQEIFRDATNIAEKGKKTPLARPIHVLDRLNSDGKKQLYREYLLQVCRDLSDRIESNEDYISDMERFPAIKRMLESDIRNVEGEEDDDMYD